MIDDLITKIEKGHDGDDELLIFHTDTGSMWQVMSGSSYSCGVLEMPHIIKSYPIGWKCTETISRENY
jgi:hypothetical protein